MKQLPIEFKKNTYQYKQHWRDADYAIYEQWDEGRLIAYEVFKINFNEAGERFGKFMEASESYPPTTQWGDNAWTVYNLEKCHSLIDGMRQKSIISEKRYQPTQTVVLGADGLTKTEGI